MTRSDYWADRADRDRDLCRTNPTAVIAACEGLAWRQTTREGKT